MFLDEKPFIYVWRPFYQNLLVPRVYPVLERAGITVETKRAPLHNPQPAPEPSLSKAPGEWGHVETLILSLLARQDHGELSELRREIDSLREQNRRLEERVIDMEAILRTLDTRSSNLQSDLAAQWDNAEKLILAILSHPSTQPCQTYSSGVRAV